MTKPRILCVDDHEANLIALEAIFSRVQCELVMINSGEDALEYLKDHEVAVILMDVQMPTMSGIEAATLIRERLARFTPILFLTAGADLKDDRKRAYQLGAADFLSKPIDVDELLSKINVFLELYRNRETAKAKARSRKFLDVTGEMAQRFRETDWSKSPLGPIETWDQSLKTAIGIMLRSSFPKFISWGPERVFLYNDAYRPILGSEKHPGAFGSRFEEIWKEIWNDLGPIVDRVEQGQSSYFEDMPLYMNRHGYFEQTYFTFSYSPILDDSEVVQGLHCSCVETTGRKKTEDDLREKSARLDAVINTMTEGVVFINPSGNLLRMNEEALRLHGFPTNADMRTVLDEYKERVELRTLDGTPLEFDQWPANRLLRGERFSSYEVLFVDRTNGREWIASYGGAPIFGEYGQLTLGVLTMRDITEQRQAEERHRRIVETIPHGIWRTMADGTADYVSPRFQQAVGYAPDELLGTGWLELVHPEDRLHVTTTWQRALKEKSPVSVEFRIRRKDGTYRWYLSLGNPFFDTDGNVISYYGTWTDIQSEKLARQEIENQSNLTKAITDNAASCLFMMDKLGHPTFMNPAAEVLTGYRLDEIKDKPLHYAIHFKKPDGTFYPMEECPIDRAQSGFRRLRNQEEVFVDKSGHLYPVSYSVTPLENNGEVVGSVLEFRDVSDQKAAERELRIAKEEAERANALKSAFLANMSHEIRTPLGAMIGFADLLRDQNLSSAERANYIDILTRNGEQLSVIINDILDLSKVEAGHLTLEYLETDPAAIASEVVSLLRVKAKEKSLSLEFHADPSTPPHLTSDPHRLRQILMNIIGNAVKFTRTGSVRIRSAGLSAEHGSRGVVFEITDTGIGVSEEQKERIFEMFVQADGSMTRRFGGTGLGLALSRKLARALGGDIVISSTAPGAGSTFLLTLPDHPEFERVSSNELPAVTTSEQGLPESPLANVRVLVVDDAPDNQQLLSRYLSRQGAIVDSAANGLEGYTKAISGQFDIVLMDIQMPVMDGYTATQKLREDGYRKPIIALTAHAMSEVRKKCLNIGCTDHLTKPINPKELIQAVIRHTRA